MKKPLTFRPLQNWTLEQTFAYYTECQIATLDWMEMKKRIPKREIERQRLITSEMIRHCIRLNLQPMPGSRLAHKICNIVGGNPNA